MNDHRWLAGAVTAIGCLLLARAAIIFVGAAFLLEMSSAERHAEFGPTFRLVFALGAMNLIFGIGGVASGIGLWRRAAWAERLWTIAAYGILVGFVVLIVATDVAWGDYVAEAFVASWSLVAFHKRGARVERAL